MPTFSYTGRRQGELVKGFLSGQDEEAVLAQLKNSAVIPLNVQRIAETKKNAWFLGAQKVALSDLLMFCRQMYTLMRAGVPLVRAVRGLAEMSASRNMTNVLFDVANTVESGKPLATAFGQHPKVFSNLFVSMIHVGENTGKLDEAFNQLFNYLELEYETRKRIKAVTRYPMIVLVTISIAIVIVNLFVIPTFAKIFKDFKAELPLATKFLIAVSDLFVVYWPFLLISVLVAIFSIRFYLKTPDGRYRWHAVQLKIPMIGKILQFAMLARFARSFAVMFRAGVPLVQTLHVTAQAMGNDFVAKRVQNIRERTEAGEALSRAVMATHLFTPLVLQMMAVGEETGSLDNMMIQVAEFYERDVDYSLKRLGEAIEPILIAMIAVMVLILALGVFLPLWSLTTALH